MGSPKEIVDPNGIAERNQYDGFGRLTEARDPEGTTVATYSGLGITTDPPPTRHPAIQVQVERQGIAGTPDGFVNTAYDSYGRMVRTRSAGFGGTEIFTEQTYD